MNTPKTDDGTLLKSTDLFADLIRSLRENTITLRDVAKRLREEGNMRCNCDLDNWEPERSTGHSHVCRIHMNAMALKHRPYVFKANAEVTHARNER